MPPFPPPLSFCPSGPPPTKCTHTQHRLRLESNLVWLTKNLKQELKSPDRFQKFISMDAFWQPRGSWLCCNHKASGALAEAEVSPDLWIILSAGELNSQRVRMAAGGQGPLWTITWTITCLLCFPPSLGRTPFRVLMWPWSTFTFHVCQSR